MNQLQEHIKYLEEENRALKAQLALVSNDGIRTNNLKNILTFNKEVILRVVNNEHATIEAISDSITDYGYSPDEFADGLTYLDLIHPDDIDHVKGMIKKNEKSKFIRNFEQDYRILKKNGSPNWVSSLTIALRDQDGTVTHYLVKINDISQRKKYEDRLQDTNENLIVTLKSIGESVISMDPDGYIVQINDAAEKLIGTISLKAKNKPLNDVIRFSHLSDFEILIDVAKLVAENKKMVQLDEVFMKSCYGGQYRVSCNISPIFVQKNKLEGYVMVIKDLTSIYRMLQTSRENEQALKTRLDLLLSEDAEVSDVALTDVISIDHLQKLQDKFSLANGVSSVIIDLEGKALTNPSNFNDSCTSIFYSGQKCFQSDKLLGDIDSFERPCKLISAKAPIYIGDKHIADWKIGMCGFGGAIAPFVKAACPSDKEYVDTYNSQQEERRKHFDGICDLLVLFANEISGIGYNNVKLARELIKGKEDEVKLQKSENTIRAIFDHSQDGIMLAAMDGTIQEWSSGYEQITGISKRKAIGKNFWDVIGKIFPDNINHEEVNNLRTEFRMMSDKMEQRIINHQIIHQKTNERRILHISLFPVITAEATMVGAISRDITEEEKSRELIRQNEKRLIENNALLTGIMQTIPAPLFAKDKDGVYIECNGAFLKLFGLTKEQVIGKKTSEVLPQFADEIGMVESRLLSNDSIYHSDIRIEVNGKMLEGITYRGIIYNKGQRDGIVGVILDTSDLKRTESELISEKDRLKALGDNFPNGSLFRFQMDMKTQQMGFTYLSKTWSVISNLSIEDSLNDITNLLDKVHPDDLSYLMEEIQKSVTTLNNFDVEIRYYYTGTEIRWLQLSSHPHRDGDFVISDGFVLDISARKRAEQELIAEKDRLEALGDNIPNGSLFRFSLDIDTQEMKIVYASGTWESITGISVEDTLKHISASFGKIYPEDLADTMIKINESARTMKTFHTEVRFWYHEETRWLQISSHPHRDQNLIIWDGLILDINDRKVVEQELATYRKELEKLVKERTEELEVSNEELAATNEELYATNEEFAVTNDELHNKNNQLEQEIVARKQVMQQLEDSEKKLRNFIRQSFEGIVITDENGIIIEWNKAQERITGIPATVAMNRPDWEVITLMKMHTSRSKEFHELVRDNRNTYLNGDKSHLPSLEDITLDQPDGTERYVHVSMFPIELAETCYFGQIIHDVTEQRLADMELEQYRNQLEQMVEMKTKELLASQERLVSLSNNLPGGVIYQMTGTGETGFLFTYISASFPEMFGVEVQNVMDNSSLFFNMIHPEDQERFLEHSITASERGFFDIECRMVTAFRKIMWIHLRSTGHLQDNTYVWDGFMIDVTTRKIAEQELEKSKNRQSILIKVLQIVQSTENIPDAIQMALSEIGHYSNVSRTYIFEKSTDGRTVSNTYEWCNERVTPEIENLQHVPISHVQGWFDAFERGEYICTSDIRNLRESEYQSLSLQNIKSILVLPLIANGINYGFIGFDECFSNSEWEPHQVELLVSLSQIVSATTRRYWAENAMRLSQQTMRTVLDNIDANIYVSDFSTSKILFANKKIKEQIGYEVEGEDCWILQENQSGACSFCPNPKLLAGSKPTGLYHWEKWNAKSKSWYECTDAAIEWVDGRLVHMEYAMDITDRKKAEEDLRQSEEMYRQLTVASPDAIVECDPGGHVRFISPRAKEMFRVGDREDITGLRMQRYVHPHDRKQAYKVFDMFIHDTISFLPQLLLIREDDTEFFGEISSASVKDKDGKTTSVIMIIRDITERKKSEMELIQAKEKAEESDKLKSAFLANMSHEIRTPINGIIGFLNFLADDNLSPKRRQEYINVINNSSVQLVKLIDDIIDVAKLEAKQMSIRPLPFQLNEFMSELYVFFDTYLQSNNKDKIALILDDSMFIDACVTYVDPMRLRQILTNLIGNAIKFTEKGYIRFGYRQKSNMLEFIVEDTGIGLAQNQLEIIFERFRQAEETNSRRYGGTGLGLTISRSLVQMMGGELHVESQQGEGSSFIFTISYLPVKPQDEHLFIESEESIEYKPFQDMVVLLVEPEPMKRSYLGSLLSATGVTLIYAHNIRQWIDLISQANHIDAVIADSSVFKAEDEDSIREVKSIRAGLPLILMIPECNDYYSRIAKLSQCNKVLEEPVDHLTLYNILKKYV